MPEAPNSSRSEVLRLGVDGRAHGRAFPGIGRYVDGLVRALAVRDDLELHRLAGQEDGRFSPLPGRAQRVRTGPWDPVALRRWSRAFDVVHAPFFPAALLSVRPTVVNVYDLIPVEHPGSMPSAVRRLGYRVALRRVLRVARRVVVLTEAVGRRLAAWRVPCPVEVVPPGVDPCFVPLTATGREAVRARLELPGPYALALGSGRPHKGLDCLMEAWRAVGPAGWTLVLAGTEGGIEPAPGVRILGFVPEAGVADLVGAADLCLQPSLAEGFGLPVLEAMAAGVAVVCSRLPELEEIAAGVARTVPPGSVPDLVQAITELTARPEARAELAQRGPGRAAEFRWSRTAARMVEVYRAAAESGGR